MARQPGVRPPVETKINFTPSGTPQPGIAGKVTYYATEEDAARNLKASERLGESLSQNGKVLYSPYTGGGTPEESSALVETCVSSGEVAKGDDSGKKKKRTKRR